MSKGGGGGFGTVSYSPDKSTATVTRKPTDQNGISAAGATGDVTYSAAGSQTLTFDVTFTFDDGSSSSATESVDLKVIRIQFDKSLYKCGYTLGGKDKCEITNGFITVDPKDEVGNVVLTLTKTTLADLKVGETNPSTGEMKFTLVGRSASTTTGRIKATLPGLSCTPSAEVRSIVSNSLKIDAVGVPNPIAFTPRNMVLNEGATPKENGVPVGRGRRCVVWTITQQVTVLDQFNEPLDPIYKGSLVEEHGSHFEDINIRVNENGAYGDPVGGYYKPFGNESLAEDNLKLAAWATEASPLPRRGLNINQQITVLVAGHNIGAVQRNVRVFSTGKISITPR